MNTICDHVKTPVETFHGTSLHLNSYLVSATPEFASGIERLERGESCILPDAMGEVRFVPDSQSNLIVCYLPYLLKDVMEPLQAGGYE